MSQTPLSSLLQLMLRAQQDASSLMGGIAAQARGGSQPNSSGYSARAISFLTEPLENGGTKLTYSSAGHSYEIVIPARTGLAGQLKALITSRDAQGNETRQTLDGPAILAAKVEGPFKALHESVVGYLKKAFGAAAFTPAADSCAPEAVKPSPASAAEPMEAAAKETLGAADEKEGYHWYLVPREGQPDLRFNGTLRAHAISGLKCGRQYVYTVHETPSGKFVALKQGLSHWPGERIRATVQVLDQLTELAAFFGHDRLAKSIYAQLGLTDQLEVVVE